MLQTGKRMTWKDESSKTWKARPSGVGTEAYSDEILSIYFCVENLSARFLWSNEVTLRVASILAWTKEIITRIETRNRLWKGREGQMMKVSFPLKSEMRGSKFERFGLLLPMTRWWGSYITSWLVAD